MISRRLFNSRFLAASTGAAFALTVSGCSKSAPRYDIVKDSPEFIQMNMRTLGADASIVLSGIDETRAIEIFEGAATRLDELNAIFNPNITTSQVSMLNVNRRVETPSDFLLALNQFSREMKMMTGQTFNVADRSLRLLYDQTVKPSTDDIALALGKGQGYASGNATLMTLSRAGTQIDFDACLNGFAADILAAHLSGSQTQSALITIGSARYAMGTRPEARPWIIDLGDQTLPLENAALAMSEPENGFVIDPRVGKLPPLHHNVSVISERAVIADALASAFALMPVQEMMARQKAILGGGLTQRLDIYVTNLSGQFIALRG